MDVATNSIQVREGGTVTAKVATNPTVEKEARLMYDGMMGVLSASRPLEGVQVRAANDSSVFTIREKAPTRAFSWFKTLLRHYAKQALTPR